MTVQVRRVAPEEALLAAALHVQALRARGRTPPDGHLDAYATAWLKHHADLPTWVAEADGRHVGLLVLRTGPRLPEVRTRAEVLVLHVSPDAADAAEGTDADAVREALLACVSRG